MQCETPRKNMSHSGPALGFKPAKKTLTTEELQQMTTRLYDTAQKRMEKANAEHQEAIDYKLNHNAVKQRTRSAQPSSKEEDALKALYHHPMERKKTSLAKLESKYAPKPAPSRTLEEQEIEAMANRLSTHSAEHKTQMLERLTVKTYGKPGEGVKVLGKDELQASVQRQYTEAIEKKKQNMEALEAKHLFHPIKTAPVDAAVVADRLYHNRKE
jgi:hypothetical protein